MCVSKATNPAKFQTASLSMPALPVDDTVLRAYLSRHALYPPRVVAPPHPGLELVVVIPSHDEPHLTATLEDLWRCRRPGCAVEVIVALNRAADAPEDLCRRHVAQVAEARAWAARQGDGTLRFHVLDFPDLPPRHAGVGLARKVGMDEAVARLAATAQLAAVAQGAMDPGSAVIACLDADCRVGPDYLTALVAHFAAHPLSPAAALPFAHDWRAEPDPRRRDGVVQYELHLRCVVAGLRLAGHPHAFHTVGSAMAVRADAYARQGGMNRRKGAEDFHFLAKLMPLGGFTEVRGAPVVPSGRDSHRVPFGTGRAMTGWMASRDGEMRTPHPDSYRELGLLLGRLDELHGLSGEGLPAFLSALPPALAGFLEHSGFAARLAEIRRHTAGPEAFRKRLLRWLDRFRVLKWLHYARDRHHPDMPVEAAAEALLAWGGEEGPGGEGFDKRAALLERFREWERDVRGG